eukprot:scaffold43102_cov60-Phaeocystis_antarctica.AAC.3
MHPEACGRRARRSHALFKRAHAPQPGCSSPCPGHPNGDSGVRTCSAAGAWPCVLCGPTH